MEIGNRQINKKYYQGVWVISKWLNLFVNLVPLFSCFPLPYKCLLKTSISFFHHFQTRLSSPYPSAFFLYYFISFYLYHHPKHIISLFQHSMTYPPLHSSICPSTAPHYWVPTIKYAPDALFIIITHFLWFYVLGFLCGSLSIKLPNDGPKHYSAAASGVEWAKRETEPGKRKK